MIASAHPSIHRDKWVHITNGAICRLTKSKGGLESIPLDPCSGNARLWQQPLGYCRQLGLYLATGCSKETNETQELIGSERLKCQRHYCASSTLLMWPSGCLDPEARPCDAGKVIWRIGKRRYLSSKRIHPEFEIMFQLLSDVAIWNNIMLPGRNSGILDKK